MSDQQTIPPPQQQQQQPFKNNSDSNTNNPNNHDNKINESKPYLIQVSSTLPSLETINTFLTTPNCGAISLFLGTTRDNFQNKPVLRLSYEGYAPMAIKELCKLADEARGKYPSVEKIVAVHFLGDCPVGETSVIVGCASHHRREGIRCTEFLIDELKARVPIWKKEVYGGEGQDMAVWKENVEWKEGRRRRVMVKEVEEGQSCDSVGEEKTRNGDS